MRAGMGRLEEFSEPPKGRVDAFSLAAGVGIINEQAVENRFNQVADGVVDHPVAERGGLHFARLRVFHGESAVRAAPVSAAQEFLLQGEQVVFQGVFKFQDVPAETLEFFGFGEGQVDIFKRYQPGGKVVLAAGFKFHGSNFMF